jgi:hypothetical protein
MATSLSEHLRQRLDTTLGELTEVQVAWEASVAETRRQFEAKLEQVASLESHLNLIAEVIGEPVSNGNGASNGGAEAKQTKPKTQALVVPPHQPISEENEVLLKAALAAYPMSISVDKLEAVGEYLSRHGEARQADIVKELGINSGSVSVALKFLDQHHLVKRGEHRSNSQVWEALTPSPFRLVIPSQSEEQQAVAA